MAGNLRPLRPARRYDIRSYRLLAAVYVTRSIVDGSLFQSGGARYDLRMTDALAHSGSKGRRRVDAAAEKYKARRHAIDDKYRLRPTSKRSERRRTPCACPGRQRRRPILGRSQASSERDGYKKGYKISVAASKQKTKGVSV